MKKEKQGISLGDDDDRFIMRELGFKFPYVNTFIKLSWFRLKQLLNQYHKERLEGKDNNRALPRSRPSEANSEDTPPPPSG